MPTLSAIAADLAAGRTTSRALVEACLERIRDPGGEGGRTFVAVREEAALAAAAAADLVLAHGAATSPLAGIPVSVKDLFDMAGETTRAGSRVLEGSPPAASDAAVVRRLRAAGTVVVGRTTMTEFAYSGVGINPHYGTPRNPYDRATGRIPGGSSSGAAVSVTDGMAAAAVGTDTGGSCRIPAALCGLVGFKPTAKRVPLEGVFPLSWSLDSVGPIAPTVGCCAFLDAVLAGLPPAVPEPLPLAGLRLGVPRHYVLDDLEAPVAAAFERALSRLSKVGARPVEVDFPQLAELPAVNARGGILAAEAYAWHRPLLERAADRYDPRVLTRLRTGERQSAADYLDVVRERGRLIEAARRVTAPLDALVMPTVPIIAPAIAALDDDEAFFRANRRLLRNTSIVNFLDRCAVSIPCHAAGEAPVGLMLVGEHDGDLRLLAIAAAVEAIVSPATG